MKRVKSGCICQTLLFSQKPEFGLSREVALNANRQEFTRYQNALDAARTKYVIVDATEQADGSILVHVKKQINETIDTKEYLN